MIHQLLQPNNNFKKHIKTAAGKKISKIHFGILCFMFAFILNINVNISDYYGITIDDIEKQATQLENAITVTDTQTARGTIHWYKFNVTEVGYFNYKLTLPEGTNFDNLEQGWRISLYKSSNPDTPIKSDENIISEFTSQNMVFEPGTYYLKVEATVVSELWAPIGESYTLGVFITNDSKWEFETNNDKTTANSITVNENYFGTLNTQNDADWYSFSTDSKGLLHIWFSPSDSVSIDKIKNGWKLTIYDEELKIIKTGSKLTGLTCISNLGLKPGKYYLQIEADSKYQTRSPIDQTYSFCVKYMDNINFESEYNNDTASADSINSDEYTYGSLYKSADTDWFVYKNTATGRFSIDFAPVLTPENVLVEASKQINNGWNIDVYDSNMNLIKHFSGITGEFKNYCYSSKPNSYYINVYPNDSLKAPVDVIYKLKMNFEPSNSKTFFESENNDTFENSNQLAYNRVTIGNLYKRNDVDVYKCEIGAGYGYMKVSLTPELESKNYSLVKKGYTLEVYDSKYNLLDKYTNIIEDFNSVRIPYSGQMCYIKIYASSTTAKYSPVDINYKLTITYEIKNAMCENEDNGSVSTATPLLINKKISGTIQSKYDQDYYKFYLSEASSVKLNFSISSETPAEEIGKGWNLYIYSSNGTTIVSEYHKIKLDSTFNINLEKGQYYIKILSSTVWSYYYSPIDCEYNLLINTAAIPAKVYYTNLSSTKSSTTLTFTNSTKATGYYIYRSTSKNGTYQKIKTIKNTNTNSANSTNNNSPNNGNNNSSNSSNTSSGSGKTANSYLKFTNTSLKSKTTYYYKIVAYKTQNGVTAISAPSTIRGVKTK